MKEVKRYQCSFCKKLAARPGTIQNHESECIKNPEGKNCYLCENAVRGGYRDNRDGSDTWVDDLPYCTLHEASLQSLRYEGITAQTCEDFTRSEDLYYYRRDKEETVTLNIRAGGTES